MIQTLIKSFERSRWRGVSHKKCCFKRVVPQLSAKNRDQFPVRVDAWTTGSHVTLTKASAWPSLIQPTVLTKSRRWGNEQLRNCLGAYEKSGNKNRFESVLFWGNRKKRAFSHRLGMHRKDSWLSKVYSKSWCEMFHSQSILLEWIWKLNIPPLTLELEKIPSGQNLTKSFERSRWRCISKKNGVFASWAATSGEEPRRVDA